MNWSSTTPRRQMLGCGSLPLAYLAAAAFSARAAEESGGGPAAPSDLKEREVEREKPRHRPSRRGRSPRKRKELDSKEERAAQPVPEPPRAREPRPPRDPAECWRFGLRTALMLPASGERRDYGASALLGVSLSPPARNGSKVAYEFGLDFGGWGESNGYESSLLGGRLNFLFPFLEGRAYALSGVGAFAEFVKDVYRGERRTNTAAALDFGCGYVFGEHLDARLTYHVWLGSEDLTGQALMSVGYCY